MSVAALLKSIEDQIEDLRWEIAKFAPKVRLNRDDGESMKEFQQRVWGHKDFRHGRYNYLDMNGEHLMLWTQVNDAWPEEIVAVETAPLDRLVERVIERVKSYRSRADTEAGYKDRY